MFFRCLTGRSGLRVRSSKFLRMIGIAMAVNSAQRDIVMTAQRAQIMSDHKLLSSFAISSLIHLILVVPVVSLMMRAQVHKLQLVPVQLVDVPPGRRNKKSRSHATTTASNQAQGRKKSPRRNCFPNRIFSRTHFPRSAISKKKLKNQKSLWKNFRRLPLLPIQAGTQEVYLEMPREAAPVPAIFSARETRKW